MELGISNATVGNYLKSDFNPVSGCYNTTYPSKVKPYAEDIKKMLTKGFAFKKIEEAIRKKGYDGAASTIRMDTTRERKLIKEAQKTESGEIEKIERKWLIRLLYKPIDDVKGINKEQLDKVIEKHPVIGQIYDVVHEFKETLFSKEAKNLQL